MSSADGLIDAAERLLGYSVRPIKEEKIAEDDKTRGIVDGELAKRILRRTSIEEAFHFYVDADRPLRTSSDSLTDFSKRIRSVDLGVIEYHLRRGDFEMWIRHLGDNELADRLRLLRETDMSGESLRNRLYEAVRSRCDELQRAMGSC